MTILENLSYRLFSLNGHDVTVAQLLAVPLVIIIGYFLTLWLAGFVANKLTKNQVNLNVVFLVRRIIFVIASILIFITILDILNVPLTAFAFVSGALAIGVGFGAQNIINNFISGWILMWERPIGIGDFLEVDNTKGTVEEINTRSTRIRRVDGVEMLIPNSKMLENTVVNWFLVDRSIRTNVRVGVAYGSPVELVSQLFLEVIQGQEEVLTDPEPIVLFDDFGDNALMFDAFFWVDATPGRDLRVIRSNIRFALTKSFEQNDIVIAYPQRDIHVDGQISLIK